MSLLESTKSLPGLQRHLLILSVEVLPVRLEVLHWDLRSLQVVPALEWVPRNFWSLPDNFAVPSAIGKWIQHLLVWSILLSRWFIEDNFWCFRSAIRRSPFQILPATNSYPWNIPGNTFLPNWWRLEWSRTEIGWFSTVAPKKLLALWMVF